MRTCCNNRTIREDLMDEIRRDARISDYDLNLLPLQKKKLSLR